MPRIPGVNHKRAILAFQKAGFEVTHKKGKHVVMSNGRQTIVLPRQNPINAITMGVIVKGSGLTVEEFKSLL